MGRADAHIHLFARGFAGRYGRSPAGGGEHALYQDLRRAHGIGPVLAVGYEGEPRYAGNNEYLAALAAGRDWLVPLAYVPPSGPSGPAELRHRWRQGFAGISVYLPDATAARRFSAWPGESVAELNRVRAVISLNATPPAAAGLPAALGRLDGCTILLSHLGLPGRHRIRPDRHLAERTLAPVLALARLPHVGVKLSGLYAVSDPPHAYPHEAAEPYVDLVLEAFGHRRLYWGSDYPVCLDAVSFAQALDVAVLSGCDDAARAAVVGGNLRRVLESR